MSEKFVICYSCQTKNTFSEKLSFRADCEKCGQDLHICKNCEFYDEKAYNECREPSAERVVEKERANLCEFFQAAQSQTAKKEEQEKLKNAAEALFKK